MDRAETIIEILKVVGALGLGGVVNHILTKEYDKYSNNKKELELPKIQHHNLIQSYFDTKIGYLNNQFLLSDEGRTMVVREVMVNKLRIWKKHLTKLAVDLDECSNGCDMNDTICTNLYTMNMKAFNNAINEYRNFYLDGNRYSKEEIEIFDLFMAKFQTYHSKQIQEIEQYIKRACHSKYVTNCIMVQSMIFDAYLSEFNKTFLDANDSIALINGELTGRVINGIEIGELSGMTIIS